jgi:cbb3-type cytochrome oxidase maturation protein
MSVLPAAVIIITIAILAGALGLAAFFWAVRTGQFSVKQMNEGAYVIFDSVEHVGKPTDQTLKKPAPNVDERTDSR